MLATLLCSGTSSVNKHENSHKHRGARARRTITHKRHQLENKQYEKLQGGTVLAKMKIKKQDQSSQTMKPLDTQQRFVRASTSGSVFMKCSGRCTWRERDGAAKWRRDRGIEL